MHGRKKRNSQKEKTEESNSGICRNVEMMIKLKTGNRYINMDRLCKDLFAGAEDNKSNPFEKNEI